MIFSYPRHWSALERGDALFQDLAGCQLNSPKSIMIEEGIYDFAARNVIFPRNCLIQGESSYGVELLSAAKLTNEHPCAFEVQDRTFLRDLTLRSTAGPNDQVCLLGPIQQQVNSPPITTEWEGLYGVGKSWCYYFWHLPAGNRITMNRCYGEAANCVLGVCQSSGFNAQIVDVNDCHFVVNPLLSAQGGAVSNPIYGGHLGVACRGGRTRLTNVLINAAAEPADPKLRLVGVTDYFNDGTADNLRIEMTGVHVRLTDRQNAREVWDFDIRKASWFALACSGYKPDSVPSRSPQTIPMNKQGVDWNFR